MEKRERQPTPAFVPGESLGQRSLAGYCPWGCKESDMTEGQTLSLFFFIFSAPESFIILRVQNCSSLPLALNDIFGQERGQCPSS